MESKEEASQERPRQRRIAWPGGGVHLDHAHHGHELVQVDGPVFVRVDVAGEPARGPLLSDLAAIVPGQFRLVHGGIDHIQQQPVGTLFLSVPGHDARHLAEVITFLKSRQARVEVLGHVAGSV